MCVHRQPPPLTTAKTIKTTVGFWLYDSKIKLPDLKKANYQDLIAYGLVLPDRKYTVFWRTWDIKVDTSPKFPQTHWDKINAVKGYHPHLSYTNVLYNVIVNNVRQKHNKLPELSQQQQKLCTWNKKTRRGRHKEKHMLYIWGPGPGAT